MKAVYIILLTILYAISIEGFIELFSPFLNLDFLPIQLSIFLSIIGVFLGLLFYWVSNFNQKLKRNIMLGVPGIILLMVIITYLIFGIFVLYDLIILLIKIIFILIMCTVPLIGAFGIFKKQNKSITGAGATILFFFFFSKILLGEFSAIVQQIEMLILFFIMFICYLELGISSVYFSHATNKMMPNNNSDELILLSFNRVLSRYIVNIFIVLLICYLLSFAILIYSSPFLSVPNGEFMDISLESIYGMWFLVGITVICAFLFWYLIPKEKQKKI